MKSETIILNLGEIKNSLTDEHVWGYSPMEHIHNIL